MGPVCYLLVMKLLRFAIVLVPILAGCASLGGKGYETTACADLNNAIGDNAKDISNTAIGRGRVGNLRLLAWVPAGAKVVSVITKRQTAKIGNLQAEQTVMRTAREHRCK